MIEAKEVNSIMIETKEADRIKNTPSVEKLLKKGYEVFEKNEAKEADSIVMEAKEADSIKDTHPLWRSC